MGTNMSKFDDCTKTAGKVAKKAAEGVAKLTDSAATAVKIKVEEAKLKSDLAELGKLSLEYFEMSDSTPDFIAEAIEQIKAQKKIIKKLKEQKSE